jgi:hypothetical protein
MKLEKLRILFRICHSRHYISTHQYAYIAACINESGKLCGGWMKKYHGHKRNGSPEGTLYWICHPFRVSSFLMNRHWASPSVGYISLLRGFLLLKAGTVCCAGAAGTTTPPTGR